jgi:capsular exopolysaccharide synthesis family protein
MRLLREHGRLICACLLLGLLGAVVVTYVQPRSYSADVRMYVAWQITPDSPSSARELALLAEQRVRSYQELARSERIGSEVVARLGLPISGGEVRSKLTADAPLDTVVLTITATDESPARAADIANAAAASMAGLVGELEQLPDPAQLPPVALRVVEPATPPQAPDWPNPPLNLAAGAAFGLLVGVGAVGLRRALDDSVRTSGQLRSLTRAPVLGALAHSRKMAKRPLLPDELRQLPDAEAVRHVRTALRLSIRGGGKAVGITSSVRDEGQTTALCNIAAAMADAGWRVLVVEADLRHPTLAPSFGLEPKPGLQGVLRGGHIPLEDAVEQVDRNLHVLGSSAVSGDPSALLGSKPMADLMATLRQRYDVVLVDMPPLLTDASAALVASLTDGCVLVVRYGRTTAEEVGDAMRVLESAPVRLLGTIMTMVPRGARVRGIGGIGGPAKEGREPAFTPPVGVPSVPPAGAPARSAPPPPRPPMPAPTMPRNGVASGGITPGDETPQRGLPLRPSPRPRPAQPR